MKIIFLIYLQLVKNMIYECDFIYHYRLETHSLFCSLTGLDLMEIIDDPDIKDRMRGSDFIKTFNKLGYNTNNRFIKFDQDTKYPIIMRCVGDQKGVWFAFVYSNGKIFNPSNNDIFDINDTNIIRKYKKSFFIKPYRLKITSMLQVWI